MVIGIDASRALRARRTGTERYSLELIRSLLALPAAGAHQWRLYVDAPPPPALLPTGDNIELCVLPSQRLWTHHALAGEVMRRRPTVLFVPAHVVPFVWPPARLPASVVTIHDLGYHHIPQAHPWRQRLYLEWSTRWSARAATAVIVISAATAGDLHRFYATPLGKVHVVHEAAPAPSAVSAEAVAAVRARYGLTRPYALFVGTLQPRKNLARLGAAYAALVQAGQADFDLVLAGGAGWLSGDLLAALDALSLGPRLHRLGFVPDAELPALYAGARLFCFPSLYEGFGLPVLEAQSYGAPVMTANRSALPEIAGDAALYVDPTDVDAIAAAMLRLSQDAALRQQLIAAGHENVKRFSWSKAAAETLAVLETAAQTKK
jgi:glycosyltransferase involved in cell wall biosynthesis